MMILMKFIIELNRLFALRDFFYTLPEIVLMEVRIFIYMLYFLQVTNSIMTEKPSDAARQLRNERQRAKRASESSTERKTRLEREAGRRRSKRTLEKPDQAADRRAQNTAREVERRASMTSAQTADRRSQNTARERQRRAAETSSELAE